MYSIISMPIKGKSGTLYKGMSFGSTSGLVTLWSPSDYSKMPVATSTRRLTTTTTTSQRYSSSSLADRPYLSSTYSSSSRYTTPIRSATVPSSYSRTSTLDLFDSSFPTTTSRLLARDRTLSESSSSSSSSSRIRTETYKPLQRYSFTPSSSTITASRTPSEVIGTEGVVSELRRKFDAPVVLSVDHLSLRAASADSSSSSAASTSSSASCTNRNGSHEATGDAEPKEKKEVVVNGDIAREKDCLLEFSTTRSTSSNSKVAEKGGLNGLRNIGNTCFMNSVIQCLSNTKPLLEYLSSQDYLNDINTSISSMKGALIKAFASVIQELWQPNTEDRIINTTAFKSQIQRFAPRFMGYSQQDAQEFLRYLLEGLHEDVNRVTTKPKPITTDIDETLSDNQKANEAWKRYLRCDDSKIADIFVGQLKSTLQCTVCGYCSVTFDPFWDLSLPIPNRGSSATGISSISLRLQNCLDAFTREEVLDGDEKPTCAKCKVRRKCTKSFRVQKFPKILVIHLKRFSPTERFRGKLSTTIEFPLSSLDMSPYAAGKGVSCSYNLYAVSNHSGTTYSGHYTAHCKHPYTGHWHEYNDSRVAPTSTKSIVTGEAYVLFYELSSQTSHL